MVEEPDILRTLQSKEPVVERPIGEKEFHSLGNLKTGYVMPEEQARIWSCPGVLVPLGERHSKVVLGDLVHHVQEFSCD